MKQVSLLYVTFADSDEAKRITKELLNKNLIVCANIFAKVSSLYIWGGDIKEDSENVAILKLRSDSVKHVTTEIEQMHSYSCPCILELPILSGNAGYLSWLTGHK